MNRAAGPEIRRDNRRHLNVPHSCRQNRVPFRGVYPSWARTLGCRKQIAVQDDATKQIRQAVRAAGDRQHKPGQAGQGGRLISNFPLLHFFNSHLEDTSVITTCSRRGRDSCDDAHTSSLSLIPQRHSAKPAHFLLTSSDASQAHTAGSVMVPPVSGSKRVASASSAPGPTAAA